MRCSLWAIGVAVCIAAGLFGHQRASGDDFLQRILPALKKTAEASQREAPVTGRDTAIEKLAREIDWLEHHIDRYGSIVAKHPDVWGESRLMAHRWEFEEQMKKHLTMEIGGTLQAQQSRSDQAFLGMAFALQAAVNRPTSQNSLIPGIFGGRAVSATAASGSTSAAPTASEDVSDLLDASITTSTTNVGGAIARNSLTKVRTDKAPLSIEPSLMLDQHKRFLDHLHELRRINEGDDIADSPGYSLNLIRIPVSLLPGEITREGRGAEITITARSVLGPELLPLTIRNLVINDVADLLSAPLTKAINSQQFRDGFYRFVQPDDEARPKKFAPLQSRQLTNQKSVRRQLKSSAAILEMLKSQSVEGVIDLAPADKSSVTTIPTSEWIRHLSDFSFAPINATRRRSRMPIPFSQLREVIGDEGGIYLTHATIDLFAGQFEGQPSGIIQMNDVEVFIREETEAAYERLATRDSSHLWETYCTPELAGIIRQRKWREVKEMRERFLTDVNGVQSEHYAPSAEQMSGRRTIRSQITRTSHQSPQSEEKTVDDQPEGISAHLAWLIICESALLNQRLIEDMRTSAGLKGNVAGEEFGFPFVFPRPCPEAIDCFAEYVERRWPIHTFALDPVSQEQNIEDSFSRRRELQMAAALAFSSGQANSQALMRFMRRLEWDMATIDINRTIIGFSHGNDTFGWRFYPRFQTPPIKGTLTTVGETLFGGPTTDADLRRRHLEPGMRECVALVVMPSFVPYATLDIRSNWFHLTDPTHMALSMHDTMKLSRSIRAMEDSTASCIRCANLYRNGEVDRLLARVKQLDRELPMQTMTVQIPFENTYGGFEIFNDGITQLAPELHGFYGAPRAARKKPTRLFLVGDGFSTLQTKVLAAGEEAKVVQMISRQILEVELPPAAGHIRKISREDGDNKFVEDVIDVHVATPYGSTTHMYVPVEDEEARNAVAPTNEALWGEPATMTIRYTYDGGTPSSPIVSTTALQLANNRLTITPPQPELAPLAADIHLSLKDGETLIGTHSVSAKYDVRLESYVIEGAALRTLLEGTASAAGLKASIQSYLQYLRMNGHLGDDDIAIECFARLGSGQDSMAVGNVLKINVEHFGASGGATVSSQK